jgi:hypothetical protein
LTVPLDTIDLVINPTYVSLCVNPPLILSGIIVLLVSIVLMLAGFLAFWTVAVGRYRNGLMGPPLQDQGGRLLR